MMGPPRDVDAQERMAERDRSAAGRFEFEVSRRRHLARPQSTASLLTVAVSSIGTLVGRVVGVSRRTPNAEAALPTDATTAAVEPLR